MKVLAYLLIGILAYSHIGIIYADGFGKRIADKSSGEESAEILDELGTRPDYWLLYDGKGNTGVVGLKGWKMDSEWTLVTIQKNIGMMGHLAADFETAIKDKVDYFDEQHHTYAVVKAENSDTAQLYADGKLIVRAAKVTIPVKNGTPVLGLNDNTDDARFYDVALSANQVMQIASLHEPYPKKPPKRKTVGTVDMNSILYLGNELPENLVVGPSGTPTLAAKGIAAQCGVGMEKSFLLEKGGRLGIGPEGFLFDSNYARGRKNTVEFSGGIIANHTNSFIKSMAPIQLTGPVKLIVKAPMALKTSFEGTGHFVKEGPSTLGLQYPCDKATGKLILNEGSLVLGPAATWGGTLVLNSGTTVKCVSKSQFGSIEEKGGKIIESDPGAVSKKDVFPQPATDYRLDQMQMEKLGRGVFAFRRNETEVMVSWRYKRKDPQTLGFNVYKNGKKLNDAPIKDITYFIDKWQPTLSKYEVKGVLENGKEASFTRGGTFTLKSNAPVGYMEIKLDPPPNGKTPDGTEYGYHPYDCSVGDVDNDGEYELIIIWWPTGDAGGCDNTGHHQVGNGWLECVKLDGTSKSLWKIDLGPNQRVGSHYIPVMVYDFDGDGKAEIVCRTSDGSVDGTGKMLLNGKWGAPGPFKDYRAEDKHCLRALNYVTIFEGATGRAMDVQKFKPGVLENEEDLVKLDDKHLNYNINHLWGSRNPGNQAYRFLSAVAYLDGVHPSVVMCRGYYSRTCMQALDWDGKKLTEHWYFCSDDPKNAGYGGQGFHSLRVGDVDFDGKDEIIYGSMVVDHDGHGLHTTGLGHGDAQHLIQAAPDVRGLRIWTCHEAKPYGVTLRDAQTGEWFIRKEGPQDTGSCNAMDIDPNAPGLELFSGTHCGIYSAKTFQQYHNPKPNPKSNYYNTLRFGIRWLGDLTTSAYPGGDAIWGYHVDPKTGRSVYQVGSLPGGKSIHSTKGAPNLQADIFGDWREEIILTGPDEKSLRLYMSPEDTKYRFWTFMEDPIYRLSVATENNGYNMPPEPGFYFGPELLGHGITFRGTNLP